jgi:hypothetical protein
MGEQVELKERSDAEVFAGAGRPVELQCGRAVTVYPLPYRLSSTWRAALLAALVPYRGTIVALARQENGFDLGKLDDAALSKLMDAVSVHLWDEAAALVARWLGDDEAFAEGGLLGDATDEDVIALLGEIVRFAYPLAGLRRRGLASAMTGLAAETTAAD